MKIRPLKSPVLVVCLLTMHLLSAGASVSNDQLGKSVREGGTKRTDVNVAVDIFAGKDHAILQQHFAEQAKGLPPGLTDFSESRSTSALAGEILKAHNAVRVELKLPPLQWSQELAAASKKWAETLLERGRFDHNLDSPYGENLFMIAGGSASPAAVVMQWASESQYYDHKSNSCSGICGHYTQLVWRRTRKVGCAVARGRGREVWVCDYDPPGNIKGQAPY